MTKIGLVAGALALCGIASGAFAADRTKDIGGLSQANDTAAIAAVKTESGSNAALGTGDLTNSQLGVRDDADAAGKPLAVGTHAYSATPDEGSIKKGVLNARVEASALGTDPVIGSSSKLAAGSADAAMPLDHPRD